MNLLTVSIAKSCARSADERMSLTSIYQLRFDGDEYL
jgi:hypothetical protein